MKKIPDSILAEIEVSGYVVFHVKGAQSGQGAEDRLPC